MIFIKKSQKALFVISTIFFVSINSSFTQAEIIEIQNEEKTFGDWKVFCEIDTMMDLTHCKIASKFYDSASVITIEPITKFLNKLFIIIPQIKIGSFVQIRVDKNDLIISRNLDIKDFGLIPISDEQKNSLYNEIKNGDFLFFRFNVKAVDKEITIKINLKDFRNALSYHNSKASR